MNEILKAEIAGWDTRPPGYLVHDFLEDENWQFYFHDFAATAVAHGLQYLADAHSHRVLFESAPLLEQAGDDWVRREQYWDFLTNSTFRRALLVRADRTIDRTRMVDRLDSLHVSSRLITSASHAAINTPQVVQFSDQSTGAALQINHPLTKAALISLMATFPQTARVGELLDQCMRTTGMPAAERARTKQQILRAWSMNLLQLYATPPELSARPCTRPEIFTVARNQAADGSRQLTNLRHEVVPIDPPFDVIVRLFDGQRTRDQLAQVFLTDNGMNLNKALVGKPASGKDAALHSIELILERLVKESLVVR